MGKYIDIQNDLIGKYGITVSETCTSWRRMHAHVKARIVCKWHQKNSMRSTFDLMHEIGHVETFRNSMRRCESEYNATQWAADRCREYGLEVPEEIRKLYQNYIHVECFRGEQRGGKGYGDLKIKW